MMKRSEVSGRFFYVEGCQKFFYFLSVLLSVSDKISKEQIL